MKSDRIDVLIEYEGDGDNEGKDGETLGTKGVWENLESVRYNQGCEGNVVRSIEEEDEGNDSVCSGITPCNGVASGADSLEDEEEQHASTRGDEKDPPADTFNK